MTKLVLFNGPPRSGKNTAANMLQPILPFDTRIIGYSHHLKRSVHAIYLGDGGWDLDPDVFDAVKDEPQEILGGKSWRQMYIYYSENVFKVLHGKDWLGKQHTQEARKQQLVLVPDSGFVEEAESSAATFLPENMLLFRIHCAGRTYTGDSRSYIDLSHVGVLSHDIDNVPGQPGVMREAVYRLTWAWLSKL